MKTALESFTRRFMQTEGRIEGSSIEIIQSEQNGKKWKKKKTHSPRDL